MGTPGQGGKGSTCTWGGWRRFKEGGKRQVGVLSRKKSLSSWEALEERKKETLCAENNDQSEEQEAEKN